MNDLGQATIEFSGPAVAGEFLTVTYRYTAGHPIDDTGYLRIAFRFASDCGQPQLTDPGGPNFCQVTTDGDCRIEPRWDIKGNIRPWGRVLVLKIMGGYLDRGETITVTYGDPSRGSPGWQLQTFVEDTFEFKTLVDPFATYQFKELAHSPTLKIEPGPPDRTLVIAPSQVQAGASFEYRLKQEDRWGNPCGMPVKHSHPGFASPGIQWVQAPDGEERSNPIEVVETSPKYSRYWADFHGQSEETIGTNTIEDYFAFARDKAGLDLAAHQGNDFQMSDAFWKHLNEVTASFNDPGRFVTFPGYEWSGNTALGGDRNVFFSTEGGPIHRSSLELVPGAASAWVPCQTAEDLFKTLRGVSDPEPFCFAHVGGRYADLRSHDSGLEWAVEVHSAWGTFEWMLDEAFARGYRVGICANSDGHKGRPGASYPGAGKFGSYGGLTCVLASELNRSAVLESLRSRRFYATTGHRPLLQVELLRAGKPVATMGDILTLNDKDVHLSATVTGTGPIESIEIRNGSSLVHRNNPDQTGSHGKRFKVEWSGAECKGRARMTTWDGCLKVDGNSIRRVSPINFHNANRPLEQADARTLKWQSNTTGGVAGFIIELNESASGSLQVSTAQVSAEYDLAAECLESVSWDCGGIAKRLEISPLPNHPPLVKTSLRWPVEHLKAGDNPLYVKVIQEDGQLAWSSPIYLLE